MAFLGIRIPHEVGRSLATLPVPGDQVPTSEMHITLLHFGDNWPISEISKSMEAAFEVTAKTHSFRVKMNKVSSFTRSIVDEKTAVITRVESDELHKMREVLTKKFDEAGVEFSKDFKDYKPHVTLAYSEEEAPEDYSYDDEEFVVHEIVLWGGDHGDDRIFVTFPLAGPKVSKNALLLQKVDIFAKIANNPPQEFLTSSKERRKTER